jgi:predicted anti-sigma-YlaC factor YlaD
MPASPCFKARPHFSDRLDGEPLPLFVRLKVGLHLRLCPQCRRVQRSLVATREALHALRDADVDLGPHEERERPV